MLHFSLLEQDSFHLIPGPEPGFCFLQYRQGLFVLIDDGSLNAILGLVKQMEVTLLGLRQLRGYVQKGPGLEILDTLISEAETKLSEIRRKMVQ